MTTRCGYVAVLGLPNAGKSTLVNQIVGSKVSIVSRKVQTTRRRLLGLQIVGDTQIVLIDTPGIFRPRKTMDRAMVKGAWSALQDADINLVLVDVTRPKLEDQQDLISRVMKSQKPAYLILNKVDQVDKDRLLEISATLNQDQAFEKTYMISALKGQGVQDLVKDLSQILPEGPWHFPEDQLTDAPLRFMAAELTREKIFEHLHQELPYSIAVETEIWEPFENGSLKIGQIVHVQKANQKAIVLGKGGSKIKKIGEMARRSIAELVGQPVHLFLHVRISENWSEDKAQYDALGLEPGK